LIWWLVIDIVGCWLLTLLAGQNVIANIRIWALCSMKAVGNCLSFPIKKPELIWTFRPQDMNWKPNSVWAVGQIPTSPLLLRFELKNGRIESWTPHKSFRSMSYLSIHIKQTKIQGLQLQLWSNNWMVFQFGIEAASLLLA
jgi:hypothetical protein